MLKKIGIAAVLVVTGLWVIGVTTLGMKRTNSLACSYMSRIQTKVSDQIPLEDEIERVKGEIAQLMPDMEKHRHELAREIVAVEKLEKEVANGQANLKQKKEGILAMTKALKSGARQVSLNDQVYSASFLAVKLDGELKSYDRCEKDLQSREQMLQARKNGVQVAREQLGTLLDKQQELQNAVAQLELELKTVRLEQTRTNFQFDDSRLAHINQSLADIQQRLRADQVDLELRTQYGEPRTPVAEKKTRSPADVLNAVQKKFPDSEEDATAGNK